MTAPTPCCRAGGNYCDRCDLLVGLDGLRVIAVERRGRDALTVTVESAPGPVGCPGCGVPAIGHGRALESLVDAPAGRLLWRKRRWRCPEPACQVVTFLEQDETIAAPRSKLTTRASWWAIEQIRREHASVNGIRRQLSRGWRTVWETIRPLPKAADADPARFDGVSTRARLLDLVPSRSGEAYRACLHERGPAFRDREEIATLDPLRGYKHAIDDQLEDARAVLDAFHIVELGTKVVDNVRRRVQQQIHGHRGRKGDPLYGVRNLLRAGESTSPTGSAPGSTAPGPPASGTWRSRLPGTARSGCAPATTRAVTARGARSPSGSPIRTPHADPGSRTPRHTPRTWRREFLGYFDTGGANNGGTEAVNGLIGLHRRIARGFRNRDNYRLRMRLIDGGI